MKSSLWWKRQRGGWYATGVDATYAGDLVEKIENFLDLLTAVTHVYDRDRLTRVVFCRCGDGEAREYDLRTAAEHLVDSYGADPHDLTEHQISDGRQGRMLTVSVITE